MMPKIETKEDYERAIDELENIELDTYAKVVRKGVLNDAIAEYEENQKQVPDLSFITTCDFDYWGQYNSFLNKQLVCEKQKAICANAETKIPQLLKYLIKAAESDPEAAQLLKDIANVNK